MLNEISLQEVGVTNYLKETSVATSNFVTYNAAAGIPACPQATPTQNRTWGSVKAMYR